jgi:hypothetical protein
MSLDNKFWGKVENKTKVGKDTILSLAEKLQNGNMKNRDTLNEIIDTLSSITGKKVSDEKRERIINKIINDKVPGNIDKMF